MSAFQARSSYIGWYVFWAVLASTFFYGHPVSAQNSKVEKVVQQGLDWVAGTQSGLGHWGANGNAHPTAMTGLAGIALLCEGSTSTQGKYADNIRHAVEYCLSKSQPNGLLGDPRGDDRYTYGHGFAMLFLSQVLGEEEDEIRRDEITEVLTRAVKFCGQAQCSSGGWGYVSAKDGGGFDEGSTTVTQMQGLRSCRDAGIPVPKEVIEKGVAYIRGGTGADGGVRYRSGGGGGGRPPITAAAIACLFSAGEYDDEFVPKMMGYCAKTLDPSGPTGHDHYAHYYYAQVMYREGAKNPGTWETYRDKITDRILREAAQGNIKGKSVVYWTDGVGPIYATSLNLTILQLEKGYLPIYQR